jgi:glyoxylase-like metal-dependent hydrolase (beta-lactamase superfamily II)
MRFFSLFSRVGFSNAYVIGPDAGGDAIVIDPGVFDASMLQAVEGNLLTVRSILVTHAHNAHVNGVRGLLKVYGAAIYASQPSILEAPAHRIADGDTLSLGDFSVRVLATPGHSMDSVCFLLDTMLFTGDTLTAGSIGRSKDGFSRALVLESVRRKLLSLGDEVLIFPGHGPPSKVGIEKLYNPFLGEKL